MAGVTTRPPVRALAGKTDGGDDVVVLWVGTPDAPAVLLPVRPVGKTPAGVLAGVFNTAVADAWADAVADA